VLIYVIAIVAVAGGLFVGLRGCTFMPWNGKAAGNGMVSISITKDYGRGLMKSGQVKPGAGDSDLDLLQKVARVQTEYGGGFVSAIDGLSSTSGQTGRKDWFYYVNGVLSGEGSGQFTARPGDAVWWDFHDWNSGDFVASVVGSYPQPFTRGYSAEPQKSTLVYGAGMESLAREVGGYLTGRGASVAYSAGEKTFKAGRGGPSIVFLSLKEASGTPWVTDMLGKKGKAFVVIDNGKLVALDASGAPSALGTPVRAVIVSKGSGMGDSSPVWLVICDGVSGVSGARGALVTDPGSLGLKVGAAVGSDGKIYALPR